MINTVTNNTITNFKLKLVGEDGNAFAILCRARSILRKGGRADLIDGFTKECTSGDYNHLLATCSNYFIVY